MKGKLTIFTLTALTCIFAAVSSGAAVFAGDIIVESKSVMAGESFTVKVWLAGNELDLTSLRLPLKFDNQYLTCTYVDFDGSMISSGMDGYYRVDDGQVTIAYEPTAINPLATFSDDSGLVATLYFTASDDAPETSVAIDSIYHQEVLSYSGAAISRWIRSEISDGSGESALGTTFAAGTIEIRRPTGVGDESDNLLPVAFELNQNYPNPFNPTTSISFSLPEKATVRLEIFNLLGQSVSILADEEFPAGHHELVWNAGDVPSGVYFYRISTGKQNLTRKMLLLK
nr:T9SS type A sorting domain-containing protein [candidate division Zixibacteria bacterium]